MKKFKFTLESLKKYNEQILDSEKNTLGRMRAQLSELMNALDEKFREIDEATEKLKELLQIGTNATRLSLHKKYISSLQQDVYRIKAQIEQKNREIAKQLENVIVATQEVSKLEKLEEQQIEEYKHAERKETEQFIEEFVSNTNFYEN